MKLLTQPSPLQARLGPTHRFNYSWFLRASSTECHIQRNHQVAVSGWASAMTSRSQMVETSYCWPHDREEKEIGIRNSSIPSPSQPNFPEAHHGIDFHVRFLPPKTDTPASPTQKKKTMSAQHWGELAGRIAKSSKHRCTVQSFFCMFYFPYFF